ncbi:response regulator [Paenibacillus sp. KN14-4R]|uniref:response regulator n=1 Tax=Paenibacillus sp. KN14-4R TaxID=3445773 RepID=UPI003FA05F63
MFNAVIVEDEELILDLMKHVIGHSKHYNIIGAFTDPYEALAALTKLKPDVVFLDVEMPKLNGLELAMQLNDTFDDVKIIFTTAYKQYALEAFQVYAFDYILKPVTPAAIERVTGRLNKQMKPTEQSALPRRKATVRCLGGLEVRSAEGELVHFSTRKAEELFAYFLCHPSKEISKWQLMDVLWPDIDEERATPNLHNTVYRVKKVLKEHELGMELLKINEGYILEPRDQQYDVLAYLQVNDNQVDVALTEDLCALYKGTLLEGKDYYWKLPLEELFSKKFHSLMHRLIQANLAEKNWEKVELKLDNFLRLYPLHEEMNRTLIELYLQMGRREQAVKHYNKFEQIYRDELGLELPCEIQRLVAMA